MTIRPNRLRLTLAICGLILTLAPLSPAMAGASSGTNMLTTAGNAALPAAQKNLLHMVTPQAYGAKGDGVTDDTAAVQAWLTELASNGTTGFCPAGTYRLTASVNAWPAKSYKVTGAADACDFYIDYNSAWAGFAIDLTNPGTPTTRGKIADWSGVQFTYDASLTAPPIAFGGNYVTDARLRDITIRQFTANRGTCLSLLGPFNLRQVANVEVWGCGDHASAHLVPSGTTFSITAATNTLSASASFFSAADVGTSFYCNGGTYPEVFTVSAFTDATHVTVSRNASVTHTGVLCGASGVTGSITSGTNTLTISAAALSSADIGRIVYIPGAGAVPDGGTINALRSTITNVSGTTVTLANNAGSTATNQPVILSPAGEIYGAQDGSNNPNDLILAGFSFEQNAGTALVIRDCTLCFLYGLKSAAFNNGSNFGQTSIESDFDLGLFTSDVTVFGADLEGRTLTGLGRVLIEGMTIGVRFDGTSGIVTTGQPLFALASNFFNATFDLGGVHSDQQIDPNWASFANLVATDGSAGGAAGVLRFGPLAAFNAPPSLPQVLRGAALANTFEVSTAALTATSNTTLATVPGLSQSLVAGATYNCAAHLTVTASGASGGLKAGFYAAGSGLTATSASFNGFAWNGTTPVANTTVTGLASNFVANTAVVTDLYVQGSLTVNTAGTINLQAAQNASNATSTVVGPGSTLQCVRVN